MQVFRNQKGFTLVELMVVVIIVLVLAGIAVPVYMHYIQEGKKSEAYAVIDSVTSGALVYFQKNNTYAGADFDDFLAQDDVDNATYFSYALSDQDANGFTVTATVNGTWGPEGATIVWTQAGANAQNGDAGTGSFSESGW
ncbi:MAG: prepilin-type N-terminal cleavage/methylation domain-containing protein [Candidatus Eisenbacteria bacterium]|nr:prepilin-type N-terminal cleavage/methylation domain-containing protein [Candidatus Eisenbacteria bacterium]